VRKGSGVFYRDSAVEIMDDIEIYIYYDTYRYLIQRSLKIVDVTIRVMCYHSILPSRKHVSNTALTKFKTKQCNSLALLFKCVCMASNYWFAHVLVNIKAKLFIFQVLFCVFCFDFS
jgi:hypothetical protein